MVGNKLYENVAGLKIQCYDIEFDLRRDVQKLDIFCVIYTMNKNETTSSQKLELSELVSDHRFSISEITKVRKLKLREWESGCLASSRLFRYSTPLISLRTSESEEGFDTVKLAAERYQWSIGNGHDSLCKGVV
jgi:hypothetical protein